MKKACTFDLEPGKGRPKLHGVSRNGYNDTDNGSRKQHIQKKHHNSASLALSKCIREKHKSIILISLDNIDSIENIFRQFINGKNTEALQNTFVRPHRNNGEPAGSRR